MFSTADDRLQSTPVTSGGFTGGLGTMGLGGLPTTAGATKNPFGSAAPVTPAGMWLSILLLLIHVPADVCESVLL